MSASFSDEIGEGLPIASAGGFLLNQRSTTVSPAVFAFSSGLVYCMCSLQHHISALCRVVSLYPFDENYKNYEKEKKIEFRKLQPLPTTD
jgi:hypothetical protein